MSKKCAAPIVWDLTDDKDDACEHFERPIVWDLTIDDVTDEMTFETQQLTTSSFHVSTGTLEFSVFTEVKDLASDVTPRIGLRRVLTKVRSHSHWLSTFYNDICRKCDIQTCEPTFLNLRVLLFFFSNASLLKILYSYRFSTFSTLYNCSDIMFAYTHSFASGYSRSHFRCGLSLINFFGCAGFFLGADKFEVRILVFNDCIA